MVARVNDALNQCSWPFRRLSFVLLLGNIKSEISQSLGNPVVLSSCLYIVIPLACRYLTAACCPKGYRSGSSNVFHETVAPGDAPNRAESFTLVLLLRVSGGEGYP